METQDGVKVQFHAFFILALDEGERSSSCLVALTLD